MGIFDHLKNKKKAKEETHIRIPVIPPSFYEKMKNSTDETKPTTTTASKPTTDTTPTTATTSKPATDTKPTTNSAPKTVVSSEPLKASIPEPPRKLEPWEQVMTTKQMYELYFNKDGAGLSRDAIKKINSEIRECFVVTEPHEIQFIRPVLIEIWSQVNYGDDYKQLVSSWPYKDRYNEAVRKYNNNEVLSPFEASIVTKKMVFANPLDSQNNPHCQTVVNGVPYQILILEQDTQPNKKIDELSRVNFDVFRFTDPKYDTLERTKIMSTIKKSQTPRIKSTPKPSCKDLYIE